MSPAITCICVAEHPTVEAVIAAIAERRDVAVLDSADTGPGRGRFTIAAFEPVETATWHEGDGDPFAGMRARLADMAPVTSEREGPLDPARFLGWIGYFAYEAGQFIELLPTRARSDIRLPIARFARFDTVAVHDAKTGQWMLVAESDRLIAEWQQLLAAAQSAEASAPPAVPEPPTHNMIRNHYLQKVSRAREYIAAGDIFQVNLARRETFVMCAPAWRTYLRLRQVNPAAYAALLMWGCTPPWPPLAKGGRAPGDFSDSGGGDESAWAEPSTVAVLSASPELFLQLRGRVAMSRPIKGTRRRGGDEAADAAMQAELAASAKDRAELAMIVDLVRNDLGRVCAYGSVQVVAPTDSPAHPYELETHPTVHHLVATVTGRLADGCDAIDLVRACFPGGSITGAPKVRAMEIIDELEPTQRSVYTGAIGMFGRDGSMTLNIAIRTMIAIDGHMHVHAGGGIVADSVPEDEYEETRAKAQGMHRALGIETDHGNIEAPREVLN